MSNLQTFSQRQGQLVLVVGPSGAGKDALLERARLAFAGDARFVFAKRTITRLPVGEDHETIGEESFLTAQNSGAYLLSWRAHGLGYGLPADLRVDLAFGRIVIANVSRSVILQAEDLGYPVTILHVTAAPVILASRIAERGRESVAEIRARLKRIAPMEWRKARMIEIRNEGTIEHGAALFIHAIQGCADQAEARV